MATKRDKFKYELGRVHPRRREDEYIERLVVPTDSLQGIALLYNTTVAELKRLNHFINDSDLHARKIIKVPSKGILIDLSDNSTTPPKPNSTSGLVSVAEKDPEKESENGKAYLDNVDNILQEIKEKAENVAANSPILQDNVTDNLLTRKELEAMKKPKEEIAWWKFAIPCIAILLVFPFLYYLYLEHLEYIHHIHHNNNNTTPHSLNH